MRYSKKLVGLAAATLLLGNTASYAGGDAANGEKLAATCAACHGADGNSTIETNPKIGGQYESYLIVALQAYRSGARNNAMMSPMAAGLSDQDIRDLAAWYASQKPSLKVAERG